MCKLLTLIFLILPGLLWSIWLIADPQEEIPQEEIICHKLTGISEVKYIDVYECCGGKLILKYDFSEVDVKDILKMLRPSKSLN